MTSPTLDTIRAVGLGDLADELDHEKQAIVLAAVGLFAEWLQENGRRVVIA